MTSIAPFLPADTQAAAADVTRAQLETKLKKGNKFTPEELAAAERRGWVEPLFKLGQSIGIASEAFRQLDKIVTGAVYDVTMSAMEADPHLVGIAAPLSKGAMKKIANAWKVKSGKQLMKGLFGRGAEGSQPSLTQLSGKSEKRIVSPEEAVEELTEVADTGSGKVVKDIAPTGDPFDVAIELILDHKGVAIKKFSIDDLKIVQKRSMEELKELSPEDAGSEIDDISRAYNLAVKELRKRGEPVAESIADLATSGLLSGDTIKELGLRKSLQSKKFNRKAAIDILSKHGHTDEAGKILDPELLEEFEGLFKGDFINVRDLFELLGF